MEQESVVQVLKSSAIRVGKLYPVLIDKYRNVIDGKHRLVADEKWPKLVLNHIKSEGERITARIVSNICRRSVSRQEKETMLSELAEVYVKAGIKPGKIAHEIVKATGMSYRWVMKYLADDFKARPNIGGRKNRRYPMMAQLSRDPVAHYATDDSISLPLSHTSRPRSVLEIRNYINTDFVQVIVQKEFFFRVEKLASRIGSTPQAIINKVLVSSISELERRMQHNQAVEMGNSACVKQVLRSVK